LEQACNRVAELIANRMAARLLRRDSQPALKVPTHLPNFFPGYRLILDRLKANTESAETTRHVHGG